MLAGAADPIWRRPHVDLVKDHAVASSFLRSSLRMPARCANEQLTVACRSSAEANRPVDVDRNAGELLGFLVAPFFDEDVGEIHHVAGGAGVVFCLRCREALIATRASRLDFRFRQTAEPRLHSCLTGNGRVDRLKDR